MNKNTAFERHNECYTARVNERPLYRRGMAHIQLTAGIAVTLLCLAVAWKIYEFVQAKKQTLSAINSATSSTVRTGSADNPLGQLANEHVITAEDLPIATAVSTYIAAAANGEDTTVAASQLVTNIASTSANTIVYTTYSEHDVLVDSDSSEAGKLRYRDDLRASLRPLLDNTQSELDLYAQFLSTHDTMYITQLSHAADNYRDAIALTLKVHTPASAIAYQTGILNAMSRFAATLDTLVNEANDPFTSVGALRNFNESEAAMYSAFNKLAGYYANQEK
jgi:hypothetical protein